MNKTEHLNWAKERALEYLDLNQLENAWLSFYSDLNKHEELRNHVGLQFGRQLKYAGFLNSVEEMKDFIKGFN
ncbi:hypothetical protein [Gloeothece verrucosa]|uniref:Uncharacterized protein n=1 Tax=Gloeothece verrucosa (strain PCC 7822) TaxID=497965 RepID=E0U6Y7_GLOV7|nr:hypothetical protein [Gloeothece verrucosa]ADN16024.1 hypothetical protein Cyan7822_4104 [Gloeothece verrucosa PCC 7822]